VDLFATFQDDLNVYMLMSYVPGGELFTHLRRAQRFTPDVTRFYLATIILALKYLHSFNIIYRDLKPENLLLDSRGYLRLTDFGFAKIVDDRTWTLCGTPEYLAPEIIQSDGHGKAADWWACGVLCYEMLVGYPPFFDESPYGIYERILNGQIHWPRSMDRLSRELIKAFLIPDRTKRLGNMIGGPQDILDHAWFRGVDWDALERREINVRFILHVGFFHDLYCLHRRQSFPVLHLLTTLGISYISHFLHQKKSLVSLKSSETLHFNSVSILSPTSFLNSNFFSARSCHDDNLNSFLSDIKYHVRSTPFHSSHSRPVLFLFIIISILSPIFPNVSRRPSYPIHAPDCGISLLLYPFFHLPS
jgi:serine/threonine protein kinase